MSELNQAVRRISQLRVLAAFAVMGTSLEECARAGDVSEDVATDWIRADERRKALVGKVTF